MPEKEQFSSQEIEDVDVQKKPEPEKETKKETKIETKYKPGDRLIIKEWPNNGEWRVIEIFQNEHGESTYKLRGTQFKEDNRTIIGRPTEEEINIPQAHLDAIKNITIKQEKEQEKKTEIETKYIPGVRFIIKEWPNNGDWTIKEVFKNDEGETVCRLEGLEYDQNNRTIKNRGAEVKREIPLSVLKRIKDVVIK